MALRETLNANFKQLSEENKVNTGYLTGGLSTEKKMFEQVKEMKRSTFDRSKFTIYDGMTLTDDGIFHNENHFGDGANIAPITINGTSWSIRCLVKSIAHSHIQNQPIYIQRDYDGKRKLGLYTNWDGLSLAVNMGLTGEEDILKGDDFVANNVLTHNWQYVELKYENQNLSLSVDNLVVKSMSINLDDYTFNYAQQQAWGGGGNVGYWSGQIDLKQCSITVDGVEVFNGNKTGIDTIKANDYDVVGTPIISEGGVASGFSGSNYITKKISLNENSIIEGAFTTPNDLSSIPNDLLIFSINNDQIALGLHAIGLVFWYIGTGTWVNVIPISDLLTNNTYNFRIEKDKITVDNVVKNISTPTFESSDIYLGKPRNSREIGFNGSIDLNSFKINVDGNLVYQPTLRIPYTQSKTGSKIVDAIYRDRVKDAYDYNGQANYYTISDTDITLPMGEVYGMIETINKTLNNRTIVEVSDKSLLPSWYVIYSDGWCEQGGNFVAPSELFNTQISFIKEFKDNNVSLFLQANQPDTFQSSTLNCTVNQAVNFGGATNRKSKAGFYISRTWTGFNYDWIAKGYIY